MHSDPAGTGTADSAARPRPRVALVANDPLERNSRVTKQAHALHASGIAVVRVGIQTAEFPDSGRVDELGQLVRVRVTDRLAKVSPTGEPVQGTTTPGRLRDLVRTIRYLAGRFKDARIITRELTDLDCSLIVASDFAAVFSAARANRVLDVPFIYDVRDLAGDTGSLHATSLSRRLVRFVERGLVSRAESVVAVSEPMAREVETRLGHSRVVVCRNGASVCMRPTEVHAPLRLLHQGQILADRRIERAVEAVADTVGVELVIQGRGPDSQRLVRLAQQRGVPDRVRFTGPYVPEQACSAANDADVGLVLYGPATRNLELTIPVKLFDYLGAGLAVLAVRTEGIASVAAGSESVVLLDADASDLRRTIIALRDDPDRVSRMKQAAAALCGDTSWDSESRVFIELVRAVLAKNVGGGS